MPDGRSYKHAQLPDGRIIYMIGELLGMLPNDWESLVCLPIVKGSDSGSLEMVLRVLTEFGLTDYAFNMQPG